MKRILIWYLPQAALFALGMYFAGENLPPGSGAHGMVLFGLLLAAAYTGGLNLLMDLSRHWNARRARR